MKKIVSIIVILFAMQTALFAQNLDENVVFNAHLLTTFNLIVTNTTQEITFQTAADYNNGVTAGAGILPGTSGVQVEATEDWHLDIECPDFLPYNGPNGPGSGSIPIDNLGVTITENGAHGLGSGEVVYTCTPGNPLALAPTPGFTIIALGTSSNAGDITDNDFTFTWEMGTMLGNMNGTSMFDQMANGDFTTGDYTTTALITLIPE